MLSAALAAGAVVARRSEKQMGFDVFLLLTALLPPVIGNSIIILSSNWLLSNIGCYLYYLGMDFTVVALMRFTADYCDINYQGTALQKAILGIVAIDVVQLLLNPVFGQAFTTAEIIVEGAPYFALVPLAGQYFHRIVAYGIFFATLGIFTYKAITAPRIYLERYAVILAVMVFAGAWQSFYIFSGTPVDRSMIGFGAFGLLVFYFALYYKPVRLLDRMLARVVSDMTEGVLFLDREGACIYANDAANRLFAIKDDADLKRCPRRVAKIAGVDALDLRQDWSRNCSTGQGGQKRYWSFDFHTIEDDRGRQVGSFLSIRNRTDEELKLRREQYFANHDRLTGLYNQEYLYRQIARRIEETPGVAYRIVGLDVKDFKLVNDVYGKHSGDQVLQGIADQLRKNATPGRVYGRLTGDKFGFLAPIDEFDAEATEQLLRTLDFPELGMSQPVVIHMGVYDVGESELAISVMFDRAFMAIQSIKHEYQRHVAFYDEKMRENVIWNQKISGQLDHAIADGQIRPYLQPMVNSEGKIEGAEVLVRWIHPDEGFLPPFKFIPHFEENGRIAQLDSYMWESACRILKDWEHRGIDLFLSVNISPKDFYFLDVYQTIADLVARYEVNPRKLRLEITETVMMSDVENRLRIIENLREAGFLVEMDDFGSGYSSLNMLKDIPVDVLKIDMMFLYKTKDQQRAHTILQTIIDLSGQLGMPSITEGVETAEQRDMLVDMGCHLFQGYYFAKPMPLDEFERFYGDAA